MGEPAGFSNHQLKGRIQAVFTEVLEYLIETGYIKLGHYYPEGKVLFFERSVQVKTAIGFMLERRVYGSLECEGCPAREVCTQSKYVRSIQFSPTLDQLRRQAFERLTLEVGRMLRSLRHFFVFFFLEADNYF